MSSHPSGSTMSISASGTASAIRRSPPPPHGITILAGASQLFEDLQARSTWVDDRGIVEAGTTVEPLARDACCNLLAALGSAVVENDFCAFGARPADFHLQRRTA
jgi:hypothetical protein